MDVPEGKPPIKPDFVAALTKGGLAGEDVSRWLDQRPALTGDMKRDSAACSAFWGEGAELLKTLPAKSARSASQRRAAELLTGVCRQVREEFLARHVEAVYRALTRDYARCLRLEELVYEAAALVPGLTPTLAAVAAESRLAQRDKEGIETDQGLFLSRVLAHAEAGTHLCHAMLLPLARSLSELPRFAERGVLEMPGAALERRGKAAIVTLRNPRFLNAEDETTLEDTEVAVDLAILDPATEIAVLRGGIVDHPKYKGRRVFSSGINLTHLYHGRIPFLWYLRRDMGIVHKIFRGVAVTEVTPDDVNGTACEKPWVAAVDAFAIGGGCQYLLAMDYVLAASDAYLTLPARKEGIIPGAANLRLARFTGDRIARQAIMSGRRLECDSPEGRLICDEVVPPAEMETALDRVIEALTSSGVVSAAGNRRAFRVVHEPLDDFRRYMAVYAREQAHCHFSPALIANLERYWNAQARQV
jgi:thioesterase DpgC